MKVELMLLGGAQAAARGGKRVTLERKTAALLALLVLDGSVSRARAACLLWPEAPETTARANLRQLLRRLRLALEDELVEGRDPLRLRVEVEVDVARGRSSKELLAGYEYDDCPELAEWLSVGREYCRNLQRRAEREFRAARRA
jgi:DNA-binding SARP family transcriptional activator